MLYKVKVFHKANQVFVTEIIRSRLKGLFISERKRCRFQPVALFPIHVFILQEQQQLLSRSLSS